MLFKIFKKILQLHSLFFFKFSWTSALQRYATTLSIECGLTNSDATDYNSWDVENGATTLIGGVIYDHLYGLADHLHGCQCHYHRQNHNGQRLKLCTTCTHTQHATVCRLYLDLPCMQSMSNNTAVPLIAAPYWLHLLPHIIHYYAALFFDLLVLNFQKKWSFTISSCCLKWAT